MSISNILQWLVVVAIVVYAVAYFVRRSRRGNLCSDCPDCKQCPHRRSRAARCSKTPAKKSEKG
ncbi:MAG: FeoB-associated Cys-rich membrane protein [Muribaculaceae bacterium]|nr:FeoB-associated Cys-rich membrane protein [Muribaculaceae bacterium]